jgi:P27 family predicted phage terminase small subunit
MAPALYDCGILTEADTSALELMCQVYGRMREAEEEVASEGMVVTTTSGNVIQNPYLGIVNRSADQLAKLYSEFGMTPSSRSRVQKADEEKEADPFAAYMGKQGVKVVVSEES